MTIGKRGRIPVNVDSVLRDLIPRYLANRGKDIETATAALVRGDFELIGSIAHNMQGSGCSFGLDELSAIGADIERAAKAVDRVDIARQLNRVEDYLSRVEIAEAAPLVAAGAVPAAGATARGGAVDVLLVDDQEMNVAIIGRFLSRAGFNVKSLSSGEAALAALAAPPPPALILLDVMMTGADGLEICRRIKSDPATRRIPVMLVSSAETGCDRIRGRAVGADAFLSKPVSREVLIEQVRSLLSTRGEGALYAEPR